MTTEYHQVPSQQNFFSSLNNNANEVDPWLITATSNMSIGWNGKKNKVKRELPQSPPSLFGPDDVPFSPPSFPPPSSYARITKKSSTPFTEEDPWVVSSDLEEETNEKKTEKDTDTDKDQDKDKEGIEEEISGQNLYKTELCRSFVETGACRYGFKCQFAHGRNELRPVLRHPKYKTEICKTFHSTGTCPYGIRCRFIHTKATDLPDSSSPPSDLRPRSVSAPSPPAVVPSKWSTSWTPRSPKPKEDDDDDVPDSPAAAASKKRLAIFRTLC